MQGMKMTFAAANNPVWLVRGEQLIEFEPDKMPVGKPMGQIRPFKLHEVNLQKNDLVIMITDGYADQFGGARGKKFMYRALKKLVVQCAALPVQRLSEQLRENFESWKGDYEQVDDVLVFGIRI